MAINNFKPFALDPNANVTSQADWEALPALLSGFTAGKASSAQVNKAIRQASFIAAALAQYTANKSGLDVLDDGDLNGFISKMGTAFGKDFQALDATLSALAGLATGANKLPYFTGNDTAAQTDLTSVGRDIIGKNTIADILTYLQLGEAAKRGVGTGSNQLPDMSAFGMSRSGQTSWDILPNGMIRQAGTVTLTPVGNFNMQVLGGVTYYTHYYRVNFPRQFPNAQIATLATLASYPFSNQATMAGKSLSTHRDTDSGTDVSRARFTVAYTTPNLGEIPTLHFEAIGY
ncbi:phage tail protein [Escherichia coli]|uniref:gp53-like domain-containing protein n=1 Tax=Escherichia coli TaxID=562 RepID=UPI00292C66BD|nr:phage tail protein [Escherichia coli]MDV0510427.1 phage tail protein [Escherichia coli]MDV1492060.1 phage tail protein [Escherichia coli]MDV1513361.1 phage tail protein [Escherichia coli]MDV1602930.1 phage tail protein [Escherichia coli]